MIAGNSGSTENYAEALTRLGASCTVTTDCRFAGDFDALLLPGAAISILFCLERATMAPGKLNLGLTGSSLPCWMLLFAFPGPSWGFVGACRLSMFISAAA